MWKVQTSLDRLFSERDLPAAERFIIREPQGWERPLLEPKLVIQSSFCNLIIYLDFMHLYQGEEAVPATITSLKVVRTKDSFPRQPLETFV